MAEIVNLRMAKKRRARADKERTADENRARHGRSKAERSLEAARADRSARQLEAHRRDRPEDD